MKSISGNHHEAFQPSSPDHCPVCMSPGIPVPIGVLKSMLRRDLRDHAREGFRLCTGPSCPIAYFGVGHVIDVTELNKAVSIKDPSPAALVCYCLQVTRGQIVAGVEAGQISSSEDAKKLTKACTGKACHVVNPGGICCGDQLRDAVATALAANNAAAAVIEHAASEDPGSTCCGRTLEKVLRGDARDGCCIEKCEL